MFFKPIFLSFIAIVLGFFLASCEKVIQIDLNSTDPKTVIEANLKEGPNLFEVRVYQTKDYFSDAPTVWFDDAVVVLTDDTGESTNLLSTGEGRYEAQVSGHAGRIYTLQVTRNGASFTASSLLPQLTEIKQLSYKEIHLPDEEDTQEVFVEFDDRADESNFYRIIVHANDSLEQDLQYFDDKYTNGNAVKWALLNTYHKGDHLQVELRSIDEAAYTYYFTLAPILSGNIDTAPGNPISNWQGGALGYFIAYNSSWIDRVVE